MASINNIVTEERSENIFSTSAIEMPLEERLLKFVQHFVLHLESALVLHYDILEGNIKKSGKIPNFIINALELPAKFCFGEGAEKIVKLFRKPLNKGFEVIERNKSLQYYELVYAFHQSKEKGRQVFVDIAIDIFASFEFQFNGITSSFGDQKAIQRVAKIAAKRFLNAFKRVEETENTIKDKFKKLGNKINVLKPQLPSAKVNYKLNALKVIEGKFETELISNPILKPDLYISFKCKKSHDDCKNKIDDWKITNIFDKVGVVENKKDSNDYNVFINSDSRCEKFGYRLRYQDENVDEYILAEMCKNICMHPVFSRSKDFYETKRETIYNFITNQNPDELQNKILKLVEEMKKDLEKNQDLLKSEIETLNYLLMEIITKHHKDIEGQIKEAKYFISQNIKKTDTIISKVEYLEHNIFKEIANKNKSKRILFRLKNPTMSFEGRKKELEELHKALMNKTTAVISQTASIVGLGGIGKTELAKKYVEKYKEYFHNIIFINAEKSETLLESFHRLAEKIEIKLISSDGKERDIKDIVEDIYEHLNEGGKTLVVFDNAEEFNDIKKFIFDISFGRNQIHTLITSRCKKWKIGDLGIIEVIQLDMFSAIEATNYLKKSLLDECDENIKSLMTLLQRFPLGLKQAVGYIKQQNAEASFRGNRKRFNIQDYIQLYNEKWSEILQKGFGEVGDLYEKTIATTWRVTIQKIEENNECGKLASFLLKIMAYLAPDDINIRRMFSKLERDTEKLYEAVHLLNGYSMINNEEGIVNIHRLVQKAIQIYLIEMKDEEGILKEALKLLKGSFFQEHVMSLWEHILNYPEIVKNNYNDSKYGIREITPIYLFIIHRQNTTEVAKILKHAEFDLNELLFFTCEIGNYEVFKFLIEKSADVYYKNSHNQTSLHKAAFGNNVKILQFLHNKGVDFNISDEYGDTPLLFAAKSNKTESIQLLLKSEADINIMNMKGKTVLYYVIKHDNIEEFKLILSKGINPNTQDKNGQTALHWAAKYCSIKILQLLIDKGCDINLTDKFGFSPLLVAASNREFSFLFKSELETIKFLLKNGADTKLVTKDGKNLMHCSASGRRIDAFQFMMELGFDLSVVDKLGNSLLHSAVLGENEYLIKFLVEKGIEANTTNKFGYSPLHYSIDMWNDISKLLIKLGANPNSMSQFDCTPLHFASTKNCFRTTINLIGEGAEINIRNKLGRTALHYASAKCHWRIIKLLLEEGAEVNVFDSKRRTPLHHLLRNGKFELMKELLKYDANPLNLDKTGHSLLHLAVIHMKYKYVDYVVRMVEGIDVNDRSVDGKTPLHLASECGRVSIVDLLIRNGGDISATDKNGNTPLDLAIKFDRYKARDFLNSILTATLT